MVSDFSRILTLLRKEKGFSQKKVAADLEISQALLSHYEKGIRECGLSFLIKCADYYKVSCDYLLGRSPEKMGQVISVEEIPDPESTISGKDNNYMGSVLPTLNKKLILNSINILYDFLSKYNNKSLTNEISVYLMISYYKMFRCVFNINKNNPTWLFSVEKELYVPLSDAAMNIIEAEINTCCQGKKVKNFDEIIEKEKLDITTESLTKNYPQAASSLLNLMKNAEFRIKKFDK